MNEQMDTSNWNKEDYQAFALIYAANVDSEVLEPEEEAIVEMVGKERADRIQRVSKTLSDFETLQVLEGERHRFYPGAEGKEQLLNEVKVLFKSDGKYSQLEQVIAHNLKRLL